jgi:hypothetical protein
VFKVLGRVIWGIATICLLCSASLDFSLTKAKADSSLFDVQPKEEKYKNLGYFKFKAESGHTYKLDIEVKNLSNENLTIDIDRLNALTSPNGGIEYVSVTSYGGSRLLDKAYEARDSLKGVSSVTLKPHETKVVTYSITVPKEVTKGTLLGGLSFKKHDGDEKHSANVKGHRIVLNKQVQRIIGVEADLTKEPVSMDLGVIPIIQSVSGNPTVNVPIKNNSPMILTDVYLQYKVIYQGKTIFRGQTDKFKVAPMSETYYPIAWGSETFKKGDYKVKAKLIYGEGKTTSKVLPFKIEEKEIKQVQEQVPSKLITDNDKSNVGLWVGVICGLLVGSCVTWVILFMVRRKRVGSKEQQKDKAS